MAGIAAIRDAAEPLLAVLPHAAWLPHKLVRMPNGKLDKPPCEGATTSNPASWFTLDSALGLLSGTNNVAGIGFAIVAGVISFDFDHCRDPFTGELADEVQVELERFNSYAYVTPSLEGIRIVGTNDPNHPLPPGKFNRWLPGGHKIEIFVGPTNFYNTFTSSLIPGYDTVRDISDFTLDCLTGLDDGRKGTNGTATEIASADPQRSIAAIRAALAIIPNDRQDWDEWCRIGMAVWRSSAGSGDGLDAWHQWSAKQACYDPAACDERWQHWFESPPTKIGYGTLVHEARKIRPLFVPPFDQTGEISPGQTGTQAGHEAPKPSRIRLLSLAELRALPPPEWLIHGLVPEKSLVVPYGPPKSGKTFIVLSAGLHIAAGMPWFGHSVKQGAVVYIAGEGTGGISIRVQAMCAVYGISEDVPFWVVPVAVNFGDPGSVDQLAKAIRDKVGAIKLALIVVDTLARAMPGADENSAQEVGLVIAACDGLKEEFECTVAPVHHEGKDGNRGARGTSALRGAWDAAFQIRTEGKRTTLIVTDQKEGESGKRLNFKMTEHAVGIGRTSLVPILQENDQGLDWEAPKRDPGGNTGLALQVLRDAIAAEGEVVPWFSGKTKDDFHGVRSETWRRCFYEKLPSLTQEARKKAFQRSSIELTKSRLIGVRDPWVWLGMKNETGHGT